MTLGRIADLEDGAELALGSVATEHHDVFGWLSDAFSIDPVALVACCVAWSSTEPIADRYGSTRTVWPPSRGLVVRQGEDAEGPEVE